MKFKDDVMFTNETETIWIAPETVSAMCKIYNRLKEEFPYEPTITSVMDGVHSSKSLHYDGLGFDVRTWADSTGKQLSQDAKNDLAYDLAVILGSDYDVVVEGSHIHIEFDQK